MTNERIEAITKALTADEAQISNLFAMEPAEAAAKLAENGYNFTADELAEYGKLLDQAKKDAEGANGELDENALENVSGGAVGLVTVALAGVAVGYWAYGQKW